MRYQAHPTDTSSHRSPVYGAYAIPINVSNQERAVHVDDELKRENGIPLFVVGDGYTARRITVDSRPSGTD